MRILGSIVLATGLLLVSWGGGYAQKKKGPAKQPDLIEGQKFSFWLEMLASKDANGRTRAASVLRKARPTEFWIKLLEDKDPKKRSAAATMLILLRKKPKKDKEKAVEAACKLLKSDDSYNKKLGVYILGSIDPDEVVATKALQPLLKDKEVRRAAATALARIRPDLTNFEKELVGLLGGMDGNTCQLTAYVIFVSKKAGGKNLVKALIAKLKDKEYAGVRKTSADALRVAARENPSAALPALFAALTDDDAKVRRSAAAALIAFRKETAKNLEPLRKLLLESKSPDQRQLAAFILTNIGLKPENISATLVRAYRAEKVDAVKKEIAKAILEIDPITADEMKLQ